MKDLTSERGGTKLRLTKGKEGTVRIKTAITNVPSVRTVRAAFKGEKSVRISINPMHQLGCKYPVDTIVADIEELGHDSERPGGIIIKGRVLRVFPVYPGNPVWKTYIAHCGPTTTDASYLGHIDISVSDNSKEAASS